MAFLTLGAELAPYIGKPIEIVQSGTVSEIQSWAGILLGTTDTWRDGVVATTTVHLNFTSIPIRWEVTSVTTQWQAIEPAPTTKEGSL